MFLNTHDRKFAAAASVTGLDHPSDSRSLSVTDWDGDGDLDLWMANRTGPRIRCLVNPQRPHGNWIALLLQGTKCNRDALGATVLVTPSDSKNDTVSATQDQEPSQKQIRMVKAGDGYLSQSSRWLHFGLGSSTDSVRATIVWPDGSREEIDQLRPNQRYRVIQSGGKEAAQLETVSVRTGVATWVDRPLDDLDERGSARVVAHAPLPLPALSYHDWKGQPHADLRHSPGRPQLIILWATWCQPCVAELSQMAAHAESWKAAGLDWVTLNLDEWEKPLDDRLTTVREAIASWDLDLPGGLATPATIEQLDAIQRVFVSRQEAMPLPMSVLLDGQGRVAFLYKGPIDEEVLRTDLETLRATDGAAWRDVAVPFPGRWYIQPAPADLLAIPQKLLELGRPRWAWQYLATHLPPPGSNRPDLEGWYNYFLPQLGDLYRRLGIEMARERPDETALAALQSSLKCVPEHFDTLAALASLYDAQKRPQETLETYRRMMSARPQDLVAVNNVAWLLATSREATLRNSDEAIQLAKRVCEATKNQFPPALDTLAAAYASAGQFEAAIATTEKALEQIGAARADSPQAISLRARLELYRKHEAYQE